jgi:dTDP-D-glucose 4,6-dehydratase
LNPFTILITGGCGFIGSNLSILLKEKYPHYQVISLDNLKRRGSESNISRLKKEGIRFIHGDIRNITDNTKINDLTGWLPQQNITTIVSDIFSWINKNEQLLKPILY